MRQWNSTKRRHRHFSADDQVNWHVTLVTITPLLFFFGFVYTRHRIRTHTSSNGNIFRVTDPLSGKSPVNSPHKGQWRGALLFSLICAWINGWVNNNEAGDLRRDRAHYDVIVMSRSGGHQTSREWNRSLSAQCRSCGEVIPDSCGTHKQ